MSNSFPKYYNGPSLGMNPINKVLRFQLKNTVEVNAKHILIVFSDDQLLFTCLLFSILSIRVLTDSRESCLEKLPTLLRLEAISCCTVDNTDCCVSVCCCSKKIRKVKC